MHLREGKFFSIFKIWSQYSAALYNFSKKKNLSCFKRILALLTYHQKCTITVLHFFTLDNFQWEHPVKPCNFKLYNFHFIGCVWVYRVYKPNFDDETSSSYCNETVYIFAFWLITTAYIFLGLFTSCICCFSIVSVIFKREY